MLFDQRARLASATRSVIEGLETRRLMSVTYEFKEDTSGNIQLHIRGNSANDTVKICDDQANQNFTIIANGNEKDLLDGDFDNVNGFDDVNFDYWRFLSFDVDLGGGKDTIEY